MFIMNLVIFVFVCPAIVLFIYSLKLNIVGDFTKMNTESEKSAKSLLLHGNMLLS